MITHHNYCYYHRDDYVIVDSVLNNNLNKYISEKDFYEITKTKLENNSLVKLKDNFDYKTYKKIINKIIENNNITIDKPHRYLDWYIWYKNRPNNISKD